MQSKSKGQASDIVVAMYCDGGIVGRKNPSYLGGVWAWCFVDKMDRRIEYNSGAILPGMLKKQITNNDTELLAAIEGMEVLPPKWKGTIYTDSKVTMYRVSAGRGQYESVPDILAKRLFAAKQRLGRFYHVGHIKGHPLIVDLKRGFCIGHGGKKTPVSRHNVFCDAVCGRIKQTLFGEK